MPTPSAVSRSCRVPRSRATLLILTLLIVMTALSARASQAELDAGEGWLTVTSSPPVLTEIEVRDVARNTERIQGLALPAGEHRVCFSGVQGYLTPECGEVLVVEGETTSFVGEFRPAVWLDVAVEPSTLRPQVIIDGVVRDQSPLSVPVGEGAHEVCFEQLGGYEPVECQTINLAAGTDHGLVVAYEPIVEDEPAIDVGITSATPVPEHGPTWGAEVGVVVASGGWVAPDVSVEVTWSTGSPAQASCTTGADGTCTFTRTAVHNRVKSVELTVVRVDDVDRSGPSVTVSR